MANDREQSNQVCDECWSHQSKFQRLKCAIRSSYLIFQTLYHAFNRYRPKGSKKVLVSCTYIVKIFPSLRKFPNVQSTSQKGLKQKKTSEGSLKIRNSRFFSPSILIIELNNLTISEPCQEFLICIRYHLILKKI